MILQYIFSMAISTNLFAMLLLFCVSVKFELAIPFFTLRFMFLRVSGISKMAEWAFAFTQALRKIDWKRPKIDTSEKN